tara:strand:+ start:737 stop:1279 length:543 start_codon:yes stop_codon:yes gene_type:complete
MKIKLIALALLFSVGVFAQKLSTRTGYVKFFSEAPVENIEAANKQVSSVINTENGEFAFLVPIKGFQFEKALMQEHFNENYMESGKFPNCTFKGTISNFSEVDFTKDGTYRATFSGVMTLHGVEKKMEEKATITVKDGKVTLSSEFKIRPEDYGVEIPAGKKDNISSVIEVTVKISYDKK